jgi:RNA polymerase sigma factor (sigma-70 family)
MPQMNVAKVFTEYKEQLVSFVRKRLTIAEDAEDVVQDIFYQLTRMGDLAKPVEQTAAWLFRVARNMIINRHKKSGIFPFLCWQALMMKPKMVYRILLIYFPPVKRHRKLKCYVHLYGSK